MFGEKEYFESKFPDAHMSTDISMFVTHNCSGVDKSGAPWTMEFSFTDVWSTSIKKGKRNVKMSGHLSFSSALRDAEFVLNNIHDGLEENEV
jgi:hypothetical protein